MVLAFRYIYGDSTVSLLLCHEGALLHLNFVEPFDLKVLLLIEVSQINGRIYCPAHKQKIKYQSDY